jgi:hypothetical protein
VVGVAENSPFTGGDHQPTEFTRVPTVSILMRITSPVASEKESGGTIPVPVSRKHP